MNIFLIVIGALLIAAPLAGAAFATARELGWKETAALWSFSFAVTAVFVAGAALISLGVTG